MMVGILMKVLCIWRTRICNDLGEYDFSHLIEAMLLFWAKVAKVRKLLYVTVLRDHSKFGLLSITPSDPTWENTHERVFPVSVFSFRLFFRPAHSGNALPLQRRVFSGASLPYSNVYFYIDHCPCPAPFPSPCPPRTLRNVNVSNVWKH